MKNLKVFFSDKKIFMYMILIPIILIVAVNFYTLNKLNNDAKVTKIGYVLNEGMKKDKAFLMELSSLQKGTAYKDKSFLKYVKCDTEDEAEKKLENNEIDMYVFLQDRDPSILMKNIEAYAAGDKKVLTKEELGEPRRLKLKTNKLNRETMLFKELMEMIIRADEKSRRQLTLVSQKEAVKKLEKNQFRKTLMPGMPVQFLLNEKEETLSLKIGKVLEEKYIKKLDEKLQAGDHGDEEFKNAIQERQRFNYRDIKEESLKENIPTEEQIEIREKQAEHHEHHSMNVVSANTTDEPFDINEVKREQEGETKEVQPKEEVKKIENKENEKETVEENLVNDEQEKAKNDESRKQYLESEEDKINKMYRDLYFKLDNGHRIYVLTLSLALIIFIQGILNIRYFSKKKELQSLEKSNLRNIKTRQMFKMHASDYITVMVINLLISFVFYYIIIGVLKVSAGISFVEGEKLNLANIFKYLGGDIPRLFERYTVYTSIGLIALYSVFVSTLSYLVYILGYNLKNKTRVIIYICLGLIFAIFATILPIATNYLSIYITRLNPIYLFLDGMYLLRMDGNSGHVFANIVLLGIYNIIAIILAVIFFNIRVKKIKKEENKLDKIIQK